MIKSKSVFEFRGRHEVLDADGAVIGMLEKDFGQLAAAQPLERSRRGGGACCSRRTRRAGSIALAGQQRRGGGPARTDGFGA